MTSSPQDYSDTPSDPSARAASLESHLPIPPTQLVGREREVAGIGTLLDRPEVRLLTLTGPGGVGKSRLAIEVAAKASSRFVHGVRFVNLGPIQDSALVAPTIARALGLRNEGEQPVAGTLIEHLQRKSLLLVLDNFEQVVDAATVVADLLAHCPGVKVVSTSRAALQIRAEHVFPVASLALARPSAGMDDATILASPAVTLFVDRARAVLPDFAPTHSTVVAIAEICARLDGLPLAIELAAALVRILTPEALLTRLHARLDLLAHGPRDLPERQQTMRNAIAWSYGLISSRDQALFRQMSVFIDGCSLDAAEAVADAGGGHGVTPPLLDSLSTLVHQNLLVQEAALAGSRFRMLETIREFALERLEATGELAVTRERHAAWCLALAEEAEPELVRENQGQWLNRLEAERENVRAALSWALDHGRAPLALLLASALWRYWSARGDLREGYRWLERALASAGDVTAAIRGTVLQRLGNLAIDLGEYTNARTHYEESLAIRRSGGEPALVAEPLNGLGLLAFHRGDYGEAERFHEESLRLRRTSDDAHGLSNSLVNLGDVAAALGDYDRAGVLYEEALEIRRRLGHLDGVGYCLFNLGNVAWQRRDFRVARTRFEESLTRFQAVGDRLGIAYVLHGLGRVSQARGEHRASAAFYAEALPLRRELGDRRGVVECIEGLATLAIQREPERAVCLFAAAGRLRAAIDAPLPPSERVIREQEISGLRVRLGTEAFDGARTTGLHLSMEEASAIASGVALTLAVNPDALPAGLSKREAEVLRLVARGHTTAQIADLLYLSPHTVNAHLQRIYRKIGVSSRTAAVRFAIDEGVA